MPFDKTKDNELKTVDEGGNKWRLAIYRDTKKTNVFSFSFFFNGKEFLIRRLASNVVASDLWDLLESIQKSPRTKKKGEDSHDDKKPKERPSKRVLKLSENKKPKKRSKPARTALAESNEAIVEEIPTDESE